MSDLGMSDGLTVSRREERRPILWSGSTVFDVVLGGSAGLEITGPPPAL